MQLCHYKSGITRINHGSEGCHSSNFMFFPWNTRRIREEMIHLLKHKGGILKHLLTHNFFFCLISVIHKLLCILWALRVFLHPLLEIMLGTQNHFQMYSQ